MDTSKEDLSCIQLVDTDNKILNKILYTFSALCHEVDSLRDEFEEMVREFQCFDESLDDNTEQLREESLVTLDRSSLLAISGRIDLLTRIKCYFERIVEVSVTIVLQLGALFDPSNKFGHFNHSSWELDVGSFKIEKYLSIIIFESIISVNVQLYSRFNVYASTVRCGFGELKV